MSNYRHSWDAKSDQDLLVAMCEVFSPSAEQIRQIVERTTSMGYSITCKAVSQHLQKLRRTATSEPGSAPATPKTPRTPKTPKAKAAPKSGTKRKNAKNDETTDSQSEEATAAKKMKVDDDSAEEFSVKSEFADMEDDCGCV